jgi:hypothetical protein
MATEGRSTKLVAKMSINLILKPRGQLPSSTSKVLACVQAFRRPTCATNPALIGATDLEDPHCTENDQGLVQN